MVIRFLWKKINFRYLGNHPTIEGKTAISITSGGSLQIGDNFICRSGFGRHILGGEYSSFNINSGG